MVAGTPPRARTATRTAGVVNVGDRVRVVRGRHRGLVGTICYRSTPGGEFSFVSPDGSEPWPCEACGGTGTRRQVVTVDTAHLEEVLL